MNPPVWQSLSELHLRPQFGGGPGGASPTSSPPCCFGNLQIAPGKPRECGASLLTAQLKHARTAFGNLRRG